MLHLFLYKSKVEFPLDVPAEDVTEKFLQELNKWLSKRSGQDTKREGNNIYFDITSNGLWETFFGIDGGEVTITAEADRMIVRYELSYMNPSSSFFILACILWGLAFLIPTKPQTMIFAVLVTMLFCGSIFGALISISSFPSEIREVWAKVKKQK